MTIIFFDFVELTMNHQSIMTINILRRKRSKLNINQIYLNFILFYIHLILFVQIQLRKTEKIKKWYNYVLLDLLGWDGKVKN